MHPLAQLNHLTTAILTELFILTLKSERRKVLKNAFLRFFLAKVD